MAKPIISLKADIPELKDLEFNQDWFFKAVGETIARELQRNFFAGKQGSDSAFKQRKHEDRADHPVMNDTGNMFRSTKYVVSSVKNKDRRVELTGAVKGRRGRSYRLNYFGLGNWLGTETSGFSRRDYSVAVKKRKAQDIKDKKYDEEKFKVRRGDRTIGKSGGNQGNWFFPSRRIIEMGVAAGRVSLASQLRSGKARLITNKKAMRFR